MISVGVYQEEDSLIDVLYSNYDYIENSTAIWVKLAAPLFDYVKAAMERTMNPYIARERFEQLRTTLARQYDIDVDWDDFVEHFPLEPYGPLDVAHEWTIFSDVLWDIIGGATEEDVQREDPLDFCYRASSNAGLIVVWCTMTRRIYVLKSSRVVNGTYLHGDLVTADAAIAELRGDTLCWALPVDLLEEMST